MEFKKTLALKIKGTLERAFKDAKYTTFLKNFGEFTVAKLEQREVSGQEFILDELRNLRMSLRRMERDANMRRAEAKKYSPYAEPGEVDVCLRNKSPEEEKSFRDEVFALPFVSVANLDDREDHNHLLVRLDPDTPRNRTALDEFLKTKYMAYRPGKDTVH